MEKSEIDRLAKVPELKAIIESESFLKEINCAKKKEEKSKRKKGDKYREENAKHNIEFGVNLHLELYLTKFSTSLEKLEGETGIPKNIIKDFFADFIKEQVFPT